ncbi:hypothetical protein POVWA2_007170 [Plasmodium ovale wallikeri]|uniref:Secreted protein n=1 Tax=Plasmodium ovale wallikeri TaxID=864142 RepID=A0A1A8YIP3_PLAOA|nr:hypothetical protein POVWA1_006960 [Plasmodium ovale wallikeri]SBT31996.1 hypothetical protein POVWA2_007170 [Plasmodium ovale wallikeri]
MIVLSVHTLRLSLCALFGARFAHALSLFGNEMWKMFSSIMLPSGKNGVGKRTQKEPSENVCAYSCQYICAVIYFFRFFMNTDRWCAKKPFPQFTMFVSFGK